MDMRTVVTPKGQYHMTPKQAQLLYYFLVNHNQVLSRRDIMQQVWDTSFLEDTRTLDVHIRWLRERIELNPSEPSYLVTVRGRGYRLSLE
jgi:two-component system phosphate regulon response regulator PhoB